jgi:hypothetical protein
MRKAVDGVDERVRQAGLLYEQAVFTGDAGPLAAADLELDAAEADLAVARGRLIHTRFLLRRDQDPASAQEDPGELALFERAARLYRALGDARHTASCSRSARHEQSSQISAGTADRGRGSSC